MNEDGLVRLNFYPIKIYETIPFLDIATGQIQPECLKDKIVILGTIEVGAGDIASTLIGLIPGPLLHYMFLSSLFDSYLMKESHLITPLLIVFMMVLPFILVLIVQKNSI